MVDVEDAVRRALRSSRPGGPSASDDMWDDVQRRIRRRRNRRRSAFGIAAVVVLFGAGLTVALVASSGDEGADTHVVDAGPGPDVTTAPDLGEDPPAPEGEPPAGGDIEPVWTRLDPGPIRDRQGYSVTWTGSELIVWGGMSEDGFPADQPKGAAYDPDAARWRELAEGPLPPREDHVAVWTGEELIVWGGRVASGATMTYVLDNGAAYDPATDSWRELPPAPLPRDHYEAVWTGTEMVVLGGGEAAVHGAAYDPATNTWREVTPPPVALANYQLEWTGHEVLLVGGERIGTGPIALYIPSLQVLAYEPSPGEWRPVAERTVNGAAAYTTAWTSRGLVIWTYSPDPDGTLLVDVASGQILRLDGFPYACEDSPRSAVVRGALTGTFCARYGYFDLRSGEWTEIAHPTGADRAEDWNYLAGPLVAADGGVMQFNAGGTYAGTPIFLQLTL